MMNTKTVTPPITQDAIILAAGFGTRMRPLTDTVPKPLVQVAGKPIIDYVIDSLYAHGVKRIIINTHYRANILQDHITARQSTQMGKKQNMDIILSHEPEIKDTGGGILQALSLTNADSIYVVSGDSIWQDTAGHPSLLTRMDKFWNPQVMDCLIGLQDIDNMPLTHGTGDYDITSNGLCIRSTNRTGKYMFTGVRILHRRIFANNKPDTCFSFLESMDNAERDQRLYGLIHTGQWHHISTKEDVYAVSDHLKKQSSSHG